MGKKILLSTLRLKRKMEANDMGTIIVLIVLAIIIWFTYMLTALGFTAPVLSGYLVGIILNLKELS